jgi:hypothetical protein
MFHNGTEATKKNPEKAGNSGDAACFIMKLADWKQAFSLVPKLAWGTKINLQWSILY